MDIRIKEGTSIDAYAIASVHVKSWQTTYRGLISNDYLDSFNVSERTKNGKKSFLTQIKKYSSLSNEKKSYDSPIVENR